MQALEENKTKDILRFIRVAILRPEQMNALLPQITQSLISGTEHAANADKIKAAAHEQILSDQHLEQFIPLVEQLFTHDEIKRLIAFYEDDAVEKYFKNGALLGPSIYSSFAKVIQSNLPSV